MSAGPILGGPMLGGPMVEVVGVSSRTASGTTLLDDVSFSVERGWLVAVVGPTGAGKTSLAKALLGQLPLSAGKVHVTTREGDGRARHGRVAGVPQEDATHPQLSLRRTLDHAAALRGDVSPIQRRHAVDAVLKELGLSARAGTRLADLSGGERKRANVAVELVGQPDLLVLDEPTAGLDPGFEKSVFASLRALADTGRTIVAITHSVRVLSVCDRVLFLAPGGTVAFFGTPSEAEAYFGWDDPADAYAALVAEPAASWKARFAAHEARPGAGTFARRAAVPVPARWAGSGGGTAAWSRPAATAPEAPLAARQDRSGHLRTLLHRAVQIASSDRRALVLSLLAGPVVGVLLWAVLPGGTLQPPEGADGGGVAAAPKAATFAFFLAMTITWLGAAGAAREVVKERHILRRELGVGVSVSTYLMGKALFLSGLAALQVLPLAAIAVIHQQAPGTGPALGSGIVEVLAVAFLVGVAAVATGLLVSSWASSSEKAMTVLPVVLVGQLALAGPWSGNRGPVIDLIRHLIPAKWAIDAVAATVLGDAPRWWTAVLCLAGLTVVQLGAAIALLQRGAPSRETERTDRFGDVGTRIATTRSPAVRYAPAALALVLGLAAAAGAVGRTGGGGGAEPEQAMAPAAAPSSVAPAPAPPAAAAPVPVTAAPVQKSAPAATPTTTRPAAATPATSRPPTTATRTVATTPPAPTTTRPATPPTTARPTTPTNPPPPAATTDPFAFSNWLLQQIFQPPPRR